MFQFLVLHTWKCVHWFSKMCRAKVTCHTGMIPIDQKGGRMHISHRRVLLPSLNGFLLHPPVDVTVKQEPVLTSCRCHSGSSSSNLPWSDTQGSAGAWLIPVKLCLLVFISYRRESADWYWLQGETLHFWTSHQMKTVVKRNVFLIVMNNVMF